MSNKNNIVSGKRFKGIITSLKDKTGTIKCESIKRNLSFIIKDVTTEGVSLLAAVEFEAIETTLNNYDAINVVVTGAKVKKQSVKNVIKKNLSSKNEVNNQADKNTTEDTNLSFLAPKDTLENLKNVTPDNFALFYHKRVRYELKDGKLKPTLKSFRGFNFNNIPFNDLISEHIKAAESFYPINRSLTLKIDWRLVLGLGTESVIETSMTLHPVYGFPYIPGQSIKGITRSWIIQSLYNGKEEKALKESELFCKIFGCSKAEGILNQDYQGAITFFDALPSDEPTLKMDVMNPHYTEYYSSKEKIKPPADYLEPKPIFFLTIEDTEFNFTISIKEKNNIEYSDPVLGSGKIIDIAERYLKEALTEHGIGAKTAVGYGHFK